MVIKWAISAKQQLKNIYAYYLDVAAKHTAREIVFEIRKAACSLALFPQMAPVELFLDDFSETYRSLVVSHIFKIVYYVDEIAKEVIIIAVWDCRQNPNRLPDEIKQRKR